MFAAFPGSGGSAKSVEKYYLRQLREGNQAAAQKLAQLLEDKLGLVSIVGLRLESWQWDTHLSEFYSGQIRQTENSKIPDHIKEIITIPLIPE